MATELSRFRIISDDTATVEKLVNELAGNYTPIVWNIQAGASGPLVTCVLVNTDELRRQTVIQAAAFQAPRPH